MRITRENLIKTAHEAAEDIVKADRRLICIYLTGSLLGENPLLGGATDIDLIVVHPGEPPARRQIIPLSAELHLDIAHLSQGVFQQPRQLRHSPWIGSYLCLNPLLLYDSRHWFEFTQASICSQFSRSDYVIQRARSLSEEAREIWMQLNAGQITPGASQTLNFLKALERAANAIAALSGPPLTERRFLLQFPQRAEEVERPGLYGGLLDLLGSGEATAETLEPWLPAWDRALMDVGEHKYCPPRLHSARRFYFLNAVDTLRHDYPDAALWILMHTWTQAMCVLPAAHASYEAWASACGALGHASGQIETRVEELDAYLDSVEETIDLWAEERGV